MSFADIFSMIEKENLKSKINELSTFSLPFQLIKMIYLIKKFYVCHNTAITIKYQPIKSYSSHALVKLNITKD